MRFCPFSKRAYSLSAAIRWTSFEGAKLTRERRCAARCREAEARGKDAKEEDKKKGGGLNR